MVSYQFLEVLTSTELYELSAWEQFTQKHSKSGQNSGAGQNSVEYGTLVEKNINLYSQSWTL